jgi:phage terminase large subunit
MALPEIRLKVPPKLEPLVLKPKRFKVAYGGRGSGKSMSVADIMLMGAHVQSLKIGCFREYQESIEDSVHSLLKSEIERLKVPGFDVQNTKIFHSNGGEFKFRGLSRNPSSVKSMHGFSRFWTEEAQTTSSSSLDILVPTLREDDSEFWFTMNPMSSADPMSQRFIEPYRDQLEDKGYYEDDLHLIVKINYTDNPWFPAVLEADRLFDFENKPRAIYDHIWKGAYNDEVVGSIILPEWFDAAVDAHKRLGFEAIGRKVASHDPSDEGKDDKSYTLRHGSVILRAEPLSTGDSNAGMLWALGEAIADRADLFVWDCDGLGVALKSQVQTALEGKRMDWAMYKGSEGVDRPEEPYDGDLTGGVVQTYDPTKTRTNKQTFKNKRAQYCWEARNRYYNTWLAVTQGKYINPEKLISISSEIKNLNKLKSETCRVPRKYNANGVFQVMSKQEMARMGIASPNLFDGSVMSLYLGEDQSSCTIKLPGMSGNKATRLI